MAKKKNKKPAKKKPIKKAVKKPKPRHLKAKKAKPVKKKAPKIAKKLAKKQIVEVKEPVEKPFVKQVSTLPDRTFLKPVEMPEPKTVKRRTKKGKLTPAGKKFLELAKEFLEAKKDAYFLSDENIAEISKSTENALLGATNSNQVVEFLIEEFPLAEGGYSDDNFNRRIFTDFAALAASKLQSVSDKIVNKLVEALIKALEFESKIPCRDDMDYDAKHDQMARQVRNLKELDKNEMVENLLRKYMFLKFFWDQEKIESQ